MLLSFGRPYFKYFASLLYTAHHEMQCFFATTEGRGTNNTFVVSETVGLHTRVEAGGVELKVRIDRKSRFRGRRTRNDNFATPEEAGIKRKRSRAKAHESSNNYGCQDGCHFGFE